MASLKPAAVSVAVGSLEGFEQRAEGHRDLELSLAKAPRSIFSLQCVEWTTTGTDYVALTRGTKPCHFAQPGEAPSHRFHRREKLLSVALIFCSSFQSLGKLLERGGPSLQEVDGSGAFSRRDDRCCSEGMEVFHRFVWWEAHTFLRWHGGN